MVVRPWSDWLVVDAEPHAARSLTVEAGESTVRKGVVRAAGPGRPTARGRQPMDVRPGERIAFLRWHAEHGPGKAAAAAITDLGGDRVMVRQGDVLFVMEGCDPRVDT